MARPADDSGPAWLGGYAQIEADITRMEEFAARLRSEVIDNYGPHLTLVTDDMAIDLPDPPESFDELSGFLQTHRSSQLNTSDLVYFYQEATWGLANAAAEVSALDRTAAAAPPPDEAG
jgi:hypothetical protein